MRILSPTRLLLVVTVLSVQAATGEEVEIVESVPVQSAAVEPVVFDETPVEPLAFNAPESAQWVKVTAYEAEATPTKSVADKPAVSPQPLTFAKRLAMLEVTLARRVAEPPNLWRFDDIESEAAKLLTAATNDTQRQSVREVVGRAQRFGAIGERHRQLFGGAPATIALANVVGVRPAASAGAANYDAVGELRPVVSKRPGAPKYALVGGDGKVVTFVTPADGLDLDPLLGKQVGARGGRGYMPEYKHRHLTAQKITQLDTLRR